MNVMEVDLAVVTPKNGLIAFASVHDDQLYMSGIAVRRNFPADVSDTQTRRHAVQPVHPIRRPIGLAIEQAIIEKLKTILSKDDA